MAGVVDSDVPKVVIKKEIEETPDSPNHADVQDSSPSQADTNGSQKPYKAWSEDETKYLLDLHMQYVEKFKENNYSKKQFFDDVVRELNVLGYNTTPDKVRNKMKYLRSRYKSMIEFNAKHAIKKDVPHQRELSELYNNPLYFEDEPFVNGTCDLSYKSSKIARNKKKTKPFAAPPGEFKSVVAKKKSSAVSKASKLKKKAKAKKTAQQPLFQCGRCMMKFPSSSEMHGHACKASVKMNHEIKKKSPPKSSQAFHWNSLITMQFLNYLKEYQNSPKNSNYRKGNVWENISTLMKGLGHKIPPAELSRKWKLLSTSYEKTVAYNNTHRDKKKCAFYKRLMELHNHHTSVSCFRDKSQPAKRTVEVSPFSFSPGPSTTLPRQQSPSFNNQKMAKHEKGDQSNVSDLLEWLNSAWSEYKEMERRRRDVDSQRHNEIMEMLSYLVESKDKHH